MDTQDDEQEKINDILNKIEPIVRCGNLEAFKDLIQAIHDVQDKTLLSSCYNNRNIDLISLVCEHTNRKLLKYLLHRSHILHYLISDDKSKECKYKETALYFAMRSNNFEILEMLYDYWTGDLHWLGHKKEYNEFDVDNLNQLHNLLVNAFHKYEELIKKKQKVDRTMILSIHSLMAFNDFQRYIYKRLNDLKRTLVAGENETKHKTKKTFGDWENETKFRIRIKETNVIRSMILTIINVYEKHKNKVLQLQREENDDLDDPVDENSDNSEDEVVIMEESSLYTTHEVYYRKLDSNICLLILDHLYLLKLRLSMPQDSYQKLENKLYHFYHHISNNWRLYLPKRKNMITCNILGKYKDILCYYRLNYNSNKLFTANNIMYYERRDFLKTIKTFKKELKTRPIEENIRKEKSKLHHDDHNYLKLIPELRDDYSLRMMTQLIGQLHSVNINTEYAVLLVQRTLQVVGEFLKSTEESLHLEPSTEALLKAEISVEIINDLKKLRDMLSHAKKCILLKRIELEKDNFNIFKAIRSELLQVKRKIDKVIKIHKPLVQRALLLNTISILCERRNELFAATGKVFLYMPTLLKYITDDYDYEQFYEKMATPLSLLKSIFEELLAILVIYLDLYTKLTGVRKTIHNNVKNEFSFYRKMIEYSLNVITKDKKKWLEIVEAIKDKESSANLSDYPNEEDANRMKSYLNKYDLGDENNEYLEEDGTLFAHIQHHWKFIENLLEFIVIKTGIFEDTDEGSQIFICLKGLKEYDYMANDVKLVVTEYLDKIEKLLHPKNKNTTNMNLQVHVQPYEFSGIKEFSNKLSKPNFLLKEEKRCLIDTLQSISTNSKKKLATRRNMLNKIEKEIAISMTTYRNFITSEQLNEEVKKILKNLVKGHPLTERDPLILRCLNNRISLLKSVTADLTVNQLVSRYKLDKTFRVLLEILLFDVFDILEGYNKNTETVKKSSKLLMEINLRNILTHGSPLLDVVGNVLDSNDLPTELVTKALEFVEDKIPIGALCTLRDSGYFLSKNNITAEQQLWLITFIKSPRWKDYILLVPEYKQLKYERSKSLIKNIIETKFRGIAITDELRKNLLLLESRLKNTQLIKEVQEKDYLSVLLSIDGGANINFIDTNKKASIHYAAIEGDICMLTMLVHNGADINIRNEENNMTALHYAAMHNFKDAVEFLLQNKADY